MIKAYLIVNSLSYLLFSVWCLMKFKTTSRFLGYDFSNNDGRSEYLSVYTGMEFGFAVFLALCAFFTSLQLAGLLFCLCLYGGLMVVRPIAALYYKNVTKSTYALGVIEYVFGIWGLIIFLNYYK